MSSPQTCGFTHPLLCCENKVPQKLSPVSALRQCIFQCLDRDISFAAHKGTLSPHYLNNSKSPNLDTHGGQKQYATHLFLNFSRWYGRLPDHDAKLFLTHGGRSNMTPDFGWILPLYSLTEELLYVSDPWLSFFVLHSTACWSKLGTALRWINEMTEIP